MARHMPVFVLQLLFGASMLCLIQKTSANIQSVHPGENITLHCDITADYAISWFHQVQSSEELKLLISAERRKLDNTFSLSYNVDEDHYDGHENSSTVDLVIIGVNDTDLGLYYCGGQNIVVSIKFGKAIRLTFKVPDDENQEPDDVSVNLGPERSTNCVFYWITIIILSFLCLVCVLLNGICMYVLRCRVQGKSTSTCRSCSDTKDSVEKEVELQYTSLGPRTESRISTPPAALETVTYATVASRASKRLSQ